MTLESLTKLEVVDSRSSLVETDASLVETSTDRQVRLSIDALCRYTYIAPGLILQSCSQLFIIIEDLGKMPKDTCTNQLLTSVTSVVLFQSLLFIVAQPKQTLFVVVVLHTHLYHCLSGASSTYYRNIQSSFRQVKGCHKAFNLSHIYPNSGTSTYKFNLSKQVICIQ